MAPFSQISKIPSKEDHFDLDAASEALKNGLSIAHLLKGHKLSPGESKWLALVAIETQSLPTLQILLDNGWDINEPESYFEPSLLGRALRSDANEEVVRWFLDHGADSNAYAQRYKLTPLSRAIHFAPVNIIQLRLDHGGSAEKGELINSVCKRPEDSNTLYLLRLLHEMGASISNALFDTDPGLSDVTKFEGTPMWISCTVGNITAVRYLVERGASPFEKAFFAQYLPLDAARKYGHWEIAKILDNVSKQSTERLQNGKTTS
ncbi:hypothetical protein AYO21_07773 [Fonsecaea monophora]|uniref:Uncharacterized protein n=1 Tax=Fonsecaea monophora TaxID=254056 RepID=A0A177F377_9EURO|nr:hypothetical protein AYO21_07773 [Fonsecaea monophora]OAG38051.1 hypothetical protein AYO21_07773 [Fonsecaea monophora]